jgi:mono/diheme cytochrome c family protein
MPPCRLIACFGIVFAALPVWADGPAKPADFAHDVAPLLKARCAECHTDGTYKGSFSIDTREAILRKKAAVPGKASASEIFRRVTSKDPEKRMPPKGPALTAKEVELLTAWIDGGMTWEDGFSFRKSAYLAPLRPRLPKLPPVRDGRDHTIDRIVDAYHAKHNVQRPEPADDVAFLRRACIDLIGQLPTPAEIDAFLNDMDEVKREKLVLRLLNEKRSYADHWLTFWNDLLRNDYAGTGYIDGGRKQISAWLYKSLVENKPYDQFARELVAPGPEAEGFARGIKWRGNVNASQVTELQFAQNVGQVFFGINLKCASCHDSFIDSWKLDDAYGLAAVIADQPLQVHRCDKPQGRVAQARFLFPELGAIDPKLPKAKRLDRLAELVTDKQNGRFTRTVANRIWHRLMGRGLVHPVDAMGSPPWNEDLLDHLANYLADNGYDLKKLIAHIVTSRTYQARFAPVVQEVPGEYVFRGPEVRRLTAEQFLDAVWQLTRAAPRTASAPVALPAFDATAPPERRYVRAALVNADALMRSLGRPNREQVVTSRPDQLTTLQALDLSNGQTLTNLLSQGAANLRKAHPKATPDELIEVIYREALCRRPNAEELTVARDLVGPAATSDALADLLWAVLMLPEFQLVR